MPGHVVRRRVTRRALLELAALGLGGLALACGRPRNAVPASGGDGGKASGTREPTAQAALPSPSTEPAPPRLANAEPQCLVTKQLGLADTYAPDDLTPLPARLLASDGVRLRKPAAEATVRLVDAAGQDGQRLFVLSGFRSYQEQERVLRDEIALFGKTQAEKQVAPPGHSEHQLGLAVDITSSKAPYELREDFGQEPEGRWLAAHAARFGFVISYPRGKERVTGYTYEPWHIRFVGAPIAEEVAASGLTLTEFLPKYNLAGGCP